MNSTSRFIKRLFDVFLAAIGLLLLWPLIVVCAAIARMDTGESGIFRQQRVGLDGKLFDVLKIRTMFRFESTKQTTVTVAGDVRISKSGRIFRNFKLDELPQLWNVLVGEMSFVGPRPDVPGYADKLTGADRRMLELRPGITGPATLKYRHEESLLSQHPNPEWYNNEVMFPDKVAINLDYMNNYSLRADLAYIFMTIRLKKLPQHLVSDQIHTNHMT